MLRERDYMLNIIVRRVLFATLCVHVCRACVKSLPSFRPRLTLRLVFPSRLSLHAHTYTYTHHTHAHDTHVYVRVLRIYIVHTLALAKTRARARCVTSHRLIVENSEKVSRRPVMYIRGIY